MTYGDRDLNIGEALTREQTRQQPTLQFETAKDKLATVIMVGTPELPFLGSAISDNSSWITDPDALSRSNPVYRSFLHWLVTNIRDDDMRNGNVVAGYRGPGPWAGTGKVQNVVPCVEIRYVLVSGPHRYTFLVFEQSKPVDIRHSNPFSTEARPRFNITEFIRDKSMSGPVCGNFQTVSDPLLVVTAGVCRGCLTFQVEVK